MQSIRTIKIRSVVDATYSKNYNRLEFNIDPDSYSTDLSESYLALRMYLAHQDLTRYTSAEIETLAANGVYVSFGNAGVSYDPTCLVKLARLYAMNDQSTPLEEINFQNVLTQTLHQICEDFEGVGSSSLLSNSSVVFGAPQSLGSFFANLLPDVMGNSSQQLPIEVHIPLKKIFGFFENKNCYLDDERLGGLRLVFELEDQKQLLQAQVVTENVVCPPVATLDAYSGLQSSLAVNPFTSLTQQVLVGAPTQPALESLVPVGVELPNLTTNGNIKNPAFFSLQPSQIDTITVQASTTTFVLEGTHWTDAIAQSMWITAGNYVRVNFKVSASQAGQLAYERQPVMMASMQEIVSVTVSGGGVLTLVIAGAHLTQSDANWVTTYATLDFFDQASEGPAPPLHLGQHIIPLPSQPNVTGLLLNQLTVDVKTLDQLASAGLVADDNGNYYGNGSQFKLSCQVKATTAVGTNVVPIQPNFTVYTNPDQPNTRSIQSNMLQAIPMQGDKTSIVSVVFAGGSDYTLTMTDLGFANNNSLRPQVLIDGVLLSQGSVYDGSAVDVTYDLFITNFNNSTNAYDGGARVEAIPIPDYTYLIDKSELVLVQQPRMKGVPMSRMFFTSKVEVATIETELPIYQRQFTVTEPNVYSILLCTPQYVATATQPECLASLHRGVTRYRWSVNNIDDTNRDLEVWTNNSHYPSSLHLEKLMDTMANDGHQVKSLSGLLTVPQTYLPIVPFPLKIFDAMDSPMGIRQHPNGFVVQFTAYGDPIHDSPVSAGTIYLFKRCVKTF